MQLATKILIASTVVFVADILGSFLFFHKILEFGIRDFNHFIGHKTMHLETRTLLITLNVFLVLGSFVLFINPKLINWYWYKQLALRKRNAVRSLYLKIPFPLDFAIYFFNVSNPDEVTKGAKPIVREVGPYAYDEWISKVDVVDNNAEDTLTYSPRADYFYNPDKTGPGLSHDDYVTVLHPVIVGAVTMAAETSPALLPILEKAIKSIFRNPKNMYITDKVRNILFDGMTINCSVTDFAGKAVCSQIKTQVPGVVEVEKNILKFSLLASRNGTLGKRTMVKRGIRNYLELGRLIEYDGMKSLNMYDDEECNRFRGTDGWIFPPGLPPDEGLWAYAGELCRTVQAKYVEHRPDKGVPTDYFEGDFGDQEHDPNEKCYCPTPKTCLKKGLYSLTKCMKVPIIASLPHFLNTHESLMNEVEGLHPDPTKHKLELYFAMEVGAPTRAYKRAQFNFQIRPNQKITVMNDVPEVLHPLLWLEEGINLSGPFLMKVKSVYYIKKINAVARWLILLLAFGGFGVSGYLYHRNRHNGTITPIKMVRKFMSNGDDVKEFNASELSSAASRISDQKGYHNRAFINEDDMNERNLKKKF